MNENSYFYNYKFFEVYKEINDDNWITFLRDHPEFDHSCLNLKYNTTKRLSLQEMLKANDSGIYYSFQKIGEIATFTSHLIKEKKVMLLSQYYLIDNKLFSGVNLKELMERNIGNISSCLYSLSSILMDHENN